MGIQEEEEVRVAIRVQLAGSDLPLRRMLPLDSFFHFEALPESSPPSLTQAPSQFAGYFKLDTTPRNNKPFRLPLIQQPADGAAFQDPIFAGLEFLRLPRVLKEEERVREVEQLDAFQELAVEEADEVEEPRNLWQEALEVKEVKLVRSPW